jgi:thiol:disulfide interchange protein DsbC
MFSFRHLALSLVGVAASLPAAFGDPNPDRAAKAQEPVVLPSDTITKDELASRYVGLNPADVHDGPFPGLYEVLFDGYISYVTTDGRYLIRGDILELPSQANLTEKRRAQNRAALLTKIDPADEIVFAAKGPAKYRVIVFTDVDCGYCRQFHRQISRVNDLGIEVRYVSYPRTGPLTESWSKAEGVWCATDRNTALTQAKLGAPVAPPENCSSNPVASEYELGRRIGITGTPSIYSETGVELGGYLPPEQLLAALQQLAK